MQFPYHESKNNVTKQIETRLTRENLGIIYKSIVVQFLWRVKKYFTFIPQSYVRMDRAEAPFKRD